MKKRPFFSIKRSYLPQISRLFTVRTLIWVVLGCLSGFLASILIWKPALPTSLFLKAERSFSEMRKDTHSLNQGYSQWKQLIGEKPEYRDGYIMLAWYARELGKTEEADGYIQKALALDPNYKIPEIMMVGMEP